MSTNLFATILSEEAPTSNYNGESEANRSVLQKISKQDAEYPIISAEAIRNALREILTKHGLPMNRSRVHSESQLAVKFQELCNPSKYADDFLFGFMIVSKGGSSTENEGEEATEEKGKKSKTRGGKKDGTYKRRSIFQSNLAVGLHPYAHALTLHQSPFTVSPEECRNSTTSALFHREVAHTAFQFPFALALDDCREGSGPTWTRALLRALGELQGVAGNQTRSLFDLSPRSIVARLTPSLVAGYPSYGFNPEGEFTALSRLHAEDLPPSEFWLGGEIVRKMSQQEREDFEARGAKLFVNPQRLLEALGNAAFGASS